MGDALGVPYELGSHPLPPPGEPPRMSALFGGIEPGQWSDDTEMACAIALVAAEGADLRTDTALDAVADAFLGWYAQGPPDVGVQTRRVLDGAEPGPARPPGSGIERRSCTRAPDARPATARSMRTAPVALAHLGDTDAIVEAAMAVSELTHADPQAGEACVLWCLAIDHAVRTGELDVRVGLAKVGPEWAKLLDEAATPEQFGHANGWVVAALQGAWAAVRDARDVMDGLERAIRGGGTPTTVATIAGGLLGAVFGATAVPVDGDLHGWPDLTGDDLVKLGITLARG